MDRTLEEVLTAHLGTDAFTIEVVRRLNTVVFPQASVEFYCRDERVYAITPEPENALISVADLRVLKGMTDAEIVSFVQRVVTAYRKRTHSKQPLSSLRLQARFRSQEELADFINASNGSPPAKRIISPKTIWNAEHRKPISARSAFLILSALKERGVLVEPEGLDWVLGQQGKRPVQGNQGATALEQLRLFLQQNDRARLVRLAGKSEIAGQFLARVQSDQGYVKAGAGVLLGYANQPAFPRGRDWLPFAEVAEQDFWSTVWEATLLIHLHQSGLLPRLIEQKHAPLREQLALLPQREQAWNEGYKAVALALTALWTYVRDAFDEVEAALLAQGRVLWVVYHDLEAVFGDDVLTRREAVTGLFEMVQNRDARHQDALRPLIFVEEPLWGLLNFENKSHFSGRELRL